MPWSWKNRTERWISGPIKEYPIINRFLFLIIAVMCLSTLVSYGLTTAPWCIDQIDILDELGKLLFTASFKRVDQLTQFALVLAGAAAFVVFQTGHRLQELSPKGLLAAACSIALAMASLINGYFANRALTDMLYQRCMALLDTRFFWVETLQYYTLLGGLLMLGWSVLSHIEVSQSSGDGNGNG